MDQLNLASRVSFVRSSSPSLSNIARLDQNVPLVLFTPVIALPTMTVETRAGGTESRQPPVDPFEEFGRDLAKHHNRVEHVPYRPSVGMTETHEKFARHAGAIVIVIWCAATGKSNNQSNSSIIASTSAQRAFADAVHEKALSGTNTAGATPMVLFVTNTAQSTLTEKDLGDKFRNYENILHSQGYNQTTSRQVVDILFSRF